MGPRKWLRRRIDRWVDARLGADYHQQAEALAVRSNELGFDVFGFNKRSLRYGALIARTIHRNYFRTESFGADNVPSEGPVLLVANHSGQLPFDGAIIGSCLMFDRKPARLVRSMIEHYVSRLPFASYSLNRLGQITGTPENCRRLLDAGEAILVFPEGAAGLTKPFSKRYQLQRFGSGFIRLALEYNAPIVPVAVIGAEEQAPGINVKPIAKLIGAPAFPVVPYPPFVPLVPLPVRYRVHFGQPITLTGHHEDDASSIEVHVEKVKHAIAALIKGGLTEREHVFW